MNIILGLKIKEFEILWPIIHTGHRIYVENLSLKTGKNMLLGGPSAG
jgi:hypothetical protein